MVRPPLSRLEHERGQRLGMLLREARGPRSMAEIAAVSGVPAETLRKIETGRIATPAFFTVAALAGALLLGRRAYLHFYGFWPHQPDNPYTESLNKQQKYVASRTLTEPLPWQNSTLLPGDAAAAVAELKQEPGPDLLVLGSGELIQSLRQRALVDEYVLMIHPLILGAGRRLFPEGAPADLHLPETVSTTT